MNSSHESHVHTLFCVNGCLEIGFTLFRAKMSTEGVGPAHRSQIVKPGIENEGSKQKVVDEEKMVTQHSE